MSIGPSEALHVAELAWPVQLIVHARARGLKLRLDEKNRILRLTCPKGASRKAALDWARRQSGWVESQIGRLDSPVLLEPGASIDIDGMSCLLEWTPGRSRSVTCDTGLIRSGGPREGFERRIASWIRAEALRRLSSETAEIAQIADLTVKSVSVGDASTRWGSCSAEGRIRYNARLLFAPPKVRRYVVAHEVAHRRHMNHGAEFHALEARLYGGDPTAARLILRQISPGLRRVSLPL